MDPANRDYRKFVTVFQDEHRDHAIIELGYPASYKSLCQINIVYFPFDTQVRKIVKPHGGRVRESRHEVPSDNLQENISTCLQLHPQKDTIKIPVIKTQF